MTTNWGSKLIFALLAVGLVRGQNTGANVVNQVVINNVTYNTTTTLTSGNLQNIGQTNHTATITFSGVTGTVLYSGTVQGSMNGTNYFNIGSVTPNFTTIVNGTIINTIGYGSYPFIRLTGTLTISAGTATITETYIGNSIPYFNITDMYQTYAAMNNFTLTSLIYGVNIQLLNTITGRIITVYGVTLSATSTLTAFDLFCSPDGTTSVVPLLHLQNAAALQFIWPSSIRPYGSCNMGSKLYLNVTGSGDAGLTINYRYE